MRTVYHGIILVGIITQYVFSQTVNITGYIKDAANGTPLAGANVIILGTSIGTAADGNGKYKLANINPGDYVVKAAYIGYLESIDSLSITGEKNIELNFNLDYTTIEGKEVVVTAQAKGQMDAINKQLNAKSIVNIVSSDRIQELPDANAAETVARVPGVTIKREGGEGNKVIIRGLSPKYNSITVEGTKLAATDTDDRSTDLSMISQYMLDGIEVTKAGTPDLDADVLGGTVDFKLKRATPGVHGNIIMQGMYNGLEDSYDDNKLVLELGNRFWNDRIGVLAQIDNEKRNRSSHGLGTAYSLQGSVEIDTIVPVNLTNLNLSDINRVNDRKNYLTVLDFNIPNGNLSYSNLNSSIDKDIIRHSQSYNKSINTRGLTSSTGSNNIDVITETFKYRQTFFSKLHLDAFSSWSMSKNKQNIYNFKFLENYAFAVEAYNATIDQIQEIAKHDTNNIRLSDYEYFRDESRETERTYGMNAKYDFRLGSQISGNIKIGNKIRKKSRTYGHIHEYAPINAAAGLTWVRDSLINEFPRISKYNGLGTREMSYYSFMDPDYDSGDFLDGRFTIGPGADLDFMLEIYNYLRDNFTRYAPGAPVNNENIMHRLHETNSILYNYAGSENYSASYIMADIDIGSKLNVITGGRFEKNKTTYQSYRGPETALPHWVTVVEEYTETRENDFWLPALFIRYRPADWLNIRFARTNTLTRPNYTDIIPLQYWSGVGRTVDYRNSFLEPGKSANIDFNISVNQNHLGLLSFGYFQKNIDDLIYSSGRRYIDDPDKYGLDSSMATWAISNYTSNNPYEVILNGYEIDYQTRFWYLPGFLSGFVLNANYTVIDSEVKYPRTVIDIAIDWGPPLTTVTTNIDTFYTDRLIDQADEVINLSLGYDYKGFSGRLSMLHKANTFTRADFWPSLRESSDDYTRWDLSMKQKLPFEGMSMYLNISNMTNAKDVTLVRGGNFPASEQHYGKTIDLGFRYSF